VQEAEKALNRTLSNAEVFKLSKHAKKDELHAEMLLLLYIFFNLLELFLNKF